MKKGLLIFIGVFTILAFVVVGTIGAVPQGITPVIYIQSLNIKSMFGKDPSINPTTKVKTIELDYFDRDLFTEVEYEGEWYIAYSLQVEILPLNVTNRAYEFVVPEGNGFVELNPEDIYAKTRGSLLIKHATPEMLGKRTSIKVVIACAPRDGGPAAQDEVTLKVNYKEK
ncbi:MAG: hypothetical protein MJ239_00355 [Bacilli bacterium]|nr:hypothetical protein [Bacilli bacterium]